MIPPQVTKAPEIISALRCNDGPVTIRLNSTRGKQTYYLYQYITDSLASYVTTDSIFAFTPRSGDAVYVSALVKPFCESKRIRVSIESREVTDHIIVMENGRLKTSTPSIWFYDGVQLWNDSLLYIIPEETGHYSAKSAIDGCETSAHYYLDRKGAHVDASPVPFDDALTIRISGLPGDIYSVHLFSSDGKMVLHEGTEADVAVLKTAHLTRGVYVAEVHSGRRRLRVKVVK